MLQLMKVDEGSSRLSPPPQDPLLDPPTHSLPNELVRVFEVFSEVLPGPVPGGGSIHHLHGGGDQHA